MTKVMLAVFLLPGVACGGNGEIVKGGYSSLLRVGENVLYDSAAASNLWKSIESHPGDKKGQSLLI